MTLGVVTATLVFFFFSPADDSSDSFAPPPVPPFMRWLDEVRADARTHGIREATLTQALADIHAPNAAILKAYNNQPEYTLTLATYLKRVVDPQRIAEGKRLAKKHAPLLQALEERFSVPRHVLLAFWGAESDFGSYQGRHAIVPALISLAYGSRRQQFYRKQLIESLKIIDAGHASMEGMKGSWAGAMGQVQFIPSTYNAYAIDYDQDGDKDIWQDIGDALASAANLLRQLGWRDNESWGKEVILPDKFKKAWAGRQPDKWRTIEQWHKLGVRPKQPNGQTQDTTTDTLPASQQKAAIILPERKSRRAFMVYANFNTILLWNRSDYFGIAIGMLSDSFQP